MNANELIDGLETASNKLVGKEHELGGRAIILYNQAATMLRQQQAEIEALKKDVEGRMGEETYQHCLDKLRQQQAEIAELKHMNRNWQISENILLLELEKLQHRELTDEDILKIWRETPINEYNSTQQRVCDFARAILRKASDK